MAISTVIFDFGGVISSPLFVGIGAFEEAEGYPRGSLLRLMFGETRYIGVEGRAVADALAGDPDAAEAEGEVEDEPDWHLLEFEPHRGMQSLVRSLNAVEREQPALWHADFSPEGFRWIDANDTDQSVYSFLRFDPSG